MNKLNKFLVSTIVLTTAVSPITVSAAATTDVKNVAAVSSSVNDLDQAESWAKDAILKAKELGFMKGDPNGNFRPQDTITRQELSVMLSNVLKLNIPNVGVSSFSDVSASNWALKYIEAVKAAGLMTGDGNGTFRPESNITREELAVILVKAAGLVPVGRGAKLAVADKDAVSPWAKDYVQTAIESGLMKGDGKQFNPQQTAQRQEVAVVAFRLNDTLATGKVSTIEAVVDGGVTINGVIYSVADSVKGILQAGNSDILKGAKVKFAASDKVLNKITYLELVNGGKAAAQGAQEFSGDLVLDGKNGVIEGDLKISADYISLKNLTVSGNLVIGKELQNDFFSSNLKVAGKTYVQGGDTNTVVFENASLGAMEISKPGVHVEPKGTTTVGDLTVTSDATISADASVVIPKLILAEGANQVAIHATVSNVEVTNTHQTSISGSGNISNLSVAGSGALKIDTSGTIGSLVVSNKNAKFTLGSSAKIDNLVLPVGTKASDVIQNYDQVKSRIPNVNGVKNPDAAPPTGGAGGSTGGGTAPAQNLTAPTLTADSTSNDATTALDITFTDNAAWRSKITAVKNGNTVLEKDTYTVAAGKITFKAGVLKAGFHTITVVATGYTNTTVTQTVETPQPIQGLLSSPTLTVWDQNDDEAYDVFPAGSILQYNVNFEEGVKFSDFSSAEVTFFVGDEEVGKNTVKEQAFADYAEAKGLSGLITAGPNDEDTIHDPFWNVGAYSSEKKPTTAVFKLVKDGVEYTSTANFTPANVKIPGLISSPTLSVWDQNDDENYEGLPAGSILQYNVNFKEGVKFSDFSSAEVTFFVGDEEVGKNTVKEQAFADYAKAKGLSGLITAGPNDEDTMHDPFWNVGAYSSEEKPTRAVFKLIKDGVEYTATADFIDLTAPTLTDDTTGNDSTNNLEITFTDNAAWSSAITAVKDGSTTLAATDYTVAAGKLTIKAGVLSAGSHTITLVATGYTNATVNQTVQTPQPIQGLLSSPMLTVWDQNDDEDYDVFSAGSILQYNVNFEEGVKFSDFSSAEVTFFVGDEEVGKNTVKEQAFADYAEAKGLSGLITAGPNDEDTIHDPFWNVGAYSSEKKPTKAVFKLVKDGVEYTSTANFTPANVQIPGLISSPTLTVWDQNDVEDYKGLPAGSILQYNVNFKEGVKFSDFSSAEVTFFVGDEEVGKNTVKEQAFADYATAKGLSGLITAGKNLAEPDADAFWNIGAYTSDKKPSKAVFTLVKDGVTYEVKAEFVDHIATSVAEEIANLPSKASITLSDKADVLKARADYNALRESQRALIGDITKLTDAEAAIAALEKDEATAKLEAAQTAVANADSLAKALNGNGSDEAKTLADAQKAIDDATTLVNALADGADKSALQGTLATAQSTITNAKNAADAVAKMVEDEIAALPAKQKVTMHDDTKVTDARTHYNALNAAQQTLVGNIKKLTDAEDEITNLNGVANLINQDGNNTTTDGDLQSLWAIFNTKFTKVVVINSALTLPSGAYKLTWQNDAIVNAETADELRGLTDVVTHQINLNGDGTGEGDRIGLDFTMLSPLATAQSNDAQPTYVEFTTVDGDIYHFNFTTTLSSDVTGL